MAECFGNLIVDKINRTECIGNSLVKINKNFADLDAAICRAANGNDQFKSIVTTNIFPHTVECRLSLSPTNPAPSTDIKNAQDIYLHPYNGNAVALWNAGAERWELKALTSTISKNLTGCDADTNYDIFLYHTGLKFEIELQKWIVSTPGATPPALDIQDGIPVKTLEPNKRLIGCLRTTVACRTEMSFGKTAGIGGSHPKLFLWNMYNQVPVHFSILDSREYSSTWVTTASGHNAQTNGPFELFGSSNNNRVSFIKRDTTILTMNSVHTCENVARYYFIHSLNLETPTVANFFAKTPGIPIYESYGSQSMTYMTHNIMSPGYHFVQMATMTYSQQPVTFNMWQNNSRHAYGTTGSFSLF
jgi:hypothetical protein